MPTVNRRQLAKGLSAVVALAQVPTAAAEMDAKATEHETLRWMPVHPGIWRATVGSPEVHTPVKKRLIPASLHGLTELPTITVPPLTGAHGGVTDRGCTLQLPLETQELIYGFGLQLLSLESRGKKRTIRVNADPKLDTGDSHAPVPFYVTTQGYGILVDSSRHVEFYCGDARLKPTQPLPYGSTAEAPQNTNVTMPVVPDNVIVEVPRVRGVDVYLFAGPTMLNVVQRYNLFSGGGPVPPDWGLGFWYRADGKSTQKSVTALAHEFRERTIPCDVFGLEPGWQSHAYSCSFTWDKGRFPDPPSLIRDFSDRQMKVNLWEHAFTHPSSPLFEPLLPHSGDYGVWGGLVPDFAGEPARRIFGDYHGRELIDMGVSGFKLDECDGSDYTGGWSFPDLSRFPSGVDGEQMHGIFGLRYQHTIFEQFQRRSRQTYGLVRSSGALATPYPFVLYSDLYDHRQFVRGVLTAGFSGLLWCPEVRDAKSEEDLIRRLQSVVFSPLAMINAWYIKNPPWKQINAEQNNADQFSENWQALEARCREIIGWRMQIVPYLKSAFQRYAMDGTPPFRALVLDYPKDDRLKHVDDQYLIGDRMMVAPLFAGEEERKIVMPEGNWRDFWTGSAVAGGATLIVPRSTERIPIFVKAGSVLPVAGIGASSASNESKQLTVQIYGDGSLPFTLPDGNGSHLRLTWDAAARNGNLDESTGSYKVVGWKQMR